MNTTINHLRLGLDKLISEIESEIADTDDMVYRGQLNRGLNQVRQAKDTLVYAQMLINKNERG